MFKIGLLIFVLIIIIILALILSWYRFTFINNLGRYLDIYFNNINNWHKIQLENYNNLSNLAHIKMLNCKLNDFTENKYKSLINNLKTLKDYFQFVGKYINNSLQINSIKSLWLKTYLKRINLITLNNKQNFKIKFKYLPKSTIKKIYNIMDYNIININ